MDSGLLIIKYKILIKCNKKSVLILEKQLHVSEINLLLKCLK
jgi:hypothetical protein